VINAPKLRKKKKPAYKNMIKAAIKRMDDKYYQMDEFQGLRITNKTIGSENPSPEYKL
jgi:hypothetical protein